MSPSKPRTFKVDHPHMHGEDVKDFQHRLKAILKDWKIDWDGFVADGDYGAVSRSVAASVIHGFGGSAKTKLKKGVTPDVREDIRRWQDGKFTDAERKRYKSRADWRKDLRERHRDRDVHSPLGVVLADSWGYHPGVHDGIDLISKPSAPLLAICKAKVIRVSDDWWGLGSPGGALADKGDGIIVLRSLTNVGPFKSGLNFCYGHAEKPTVRVGEVVEAGQVIGHAGFANAWHIHFMVNGRNDDRGVGDRDPAPFYRYASKR